MATWRAGLQRRLESVVMRSAGPNERAIGSAFRSGGLPRSVDVGLHRLAI